MRKARLRRSRGGMPRASSGASTLDRKSTRLNSSHSQISYAVFCLKKKIRALSEDRRGHIWIGTWFDGIYRYDGHSFHHYLLGIESPGNAVGAILPDRLGGH